MLSVPVKILITSIIIGGLSLAWIEETDEESVGWQIIRGIIVTCLIALIGSILWIIWTG